MSHHEQIDQIREIHRPESCPNCGRGPESILWANGPHAVRGWFCAGCNLVLDATNCTEEPAAKFKGLTPVEYADEGGYRCPTCGSEDQWAGSDWRNGDDFTTVMRSMECKSCKATWTEVYILDGYSDLKDQHGNPVVIDD